MPHQYGCKLSRLIYTVLLIGLSGLVSSCAYAPVQEMSDARQAIQAARLVGAETKAPHKFSQAQALMDQAVSDLDEGSFDIARENAKAAWQAAVDARKLVEDAPAP